ncbi:MAG TPA: YicC family protein [Candidatus Pygmaiobacter gallistercoris]|nr:YicC family protein [Candidatus Pygmaiobacter gallistercoris]
MVFSMTGYGRGQQVLHGREITVEIKSVNSRYFEYSSRIPRAYSWVDERLKRQLSSAIARGKAELSLTVTEVEGAAAEIHVNESLAREYLNALRGLAQSLSVEDDVTVNTLVRFSDIFTVEKPQMDEEEVLGDVISVAQQAIEAFRAMRQTEGEKLCEDVLTRLARIEEMVNEIEQLAEGRVEVYTRRLYEKLKALLEDRTVDDARILTEAAIFADKTAVDEETVRLHSHIRQYREILSAGGPVGRKLDFLTQELNRETNTIGSKTQDLAVTRLVVEIKAEIEKIREQIQNIE